MSPHRRAGDRRRPAWPPEKRGASLLLLVMPLTIGVALSPAQAADASGHSAHPGFPAVWICLLDPHRNASVRPYCGASFTSSIATHPCRVPAYIQTRIGVPPKADTVIVYK